MKCCTNQPGELRCVEEEEEEEEKDEENEKDQDGQGRGKGRVTNRLLTGHGSVCDDIGHGSSSSHGSGTDASVGVSASSKNDDQQERHHRHHRREGGWGLRTLRVGYIPQTPFILSGSIRENILMGRRFDPVAFEAAVDAADLHSGVCRSGAGKVQGRCR